jgi:hypothetical protein
VDTGGDIRLRCLAGKKPRTSKIDKIKKESTY